MICNETLKDYEWKYGDGTCNHCLSIIESCLQDDFLEEKTSQFEDHQEGVREVFEIFDGEQTSSQQDELPRIGKLVIIGRGVQGIDFERSLLRALKDR